MSGSKVLQNKEHSCLPLTFHLSAKKPTLTCGMLVLRRLMLLKYGKELKKFEILKSAKIDKSFIQSKHFLVLGHKL